MDIKVAQSLARIAYILLKLKMISEDRYHKLIDDLQIKVFERYDSLRNDK